MTSFFAQSFEYFSDKRSSIFAVLATTRPIFNSSIIPVTLNMGDLWYALTHSTRFRPLPVQPLFQILVLSHTLQFSSRLMFVESFDESFSVDLVGALIEERRYFCRTLKHFRTKCPAALALVCEHVLSLETLDCSSSFIRDLEPIAHLSRLKELNLSDLVYGLSDEPLQHLAGLTSLEVLSLDHSRNITGTGFVYFRGMRSLRVLSVRGIVQENLCDEGPLCLPELPSLTELRLKGNNKITDIGFAALSKQKNLRILDLSSSGISLEGLKGLRDLCDLTDLDLSSCRKVDDECLSVFASFEGSLRRLTLEHCRSVSDVGITSIVNEMKDLVFLDVSGCKELTDASLKAISYLPFLTELGIFWDLPLVSDSGIEHLKKCPCLSHFTFRSHYYWDSGPRLITDLSLEALSEMKSLTDLSLSFNSLTDRGVAKLADSKSLERLRLSGCDRIITNDAMLALSKSKSLRMIQVSYREGINKHKAHKQFFEGSNIHFEKLGSP